MRILFLTDGGRNKASTRYRVYQWLPYLEKSGWSCRIIFARRIRPAKFIRIVTSVLWSDVVFIQKRVFSRPMTVLIRLLNRRTVFDFDDAMFARESYVTKPSSIGYGAHRTIRRLECLLRTAGIVLAGNRFLAEYGERFNTRVVVIPTVVDHESYRCHLGRTEGVFRLGWIGSGANLFYLDTIRHEIRKVAGMIPRFELVVISDRDFELDGVAVTNVRWDLATYHAELSNLDAGLMPLLDDEWSRGKCAFKAVQFMAAGVPVIASDVSANTELITDGVDGFLIRNGSEWASRIIELAGDDRLRARLGAAAVEKIRAGYSVVAWKELFEGVLKEVAAAGRRS